MKDDAANKDFPVYQDRYTEFIDLAAHDLDAPVRKLTLLIERMAEKLKSGRPVDEHLPRIQSSLSELRGMIDGLVELSRQSAPTYAIIKVNLQDLVAAEVAALRNKNKARPISVSFSNLPIIKGDPAALKILVRQLFENAIRFSSEDRPLELVITSSVTNPQEESRLPSEPGRSYYKIIFKDNGTGFADAEAQRLFEPFVRLHGKSAYPGYGLGLPLCKRIAENHHGLIYAEPIDNAGAQFVLLLPQSLD